MAYKMKKGRPKKSVDFFTALTTKGKLKESGIKDGYTYRIYEFQGKDFKFINMTPHQLNSIPKRIGV